MRPPGRGRLARGAQSLPLPLRHRLLRVERVRRARGRAQGGAATVRVGRRVVAAGARRRGAGDANKTLWCGFVIEDATGQRVYFAGDTAYGDVFKQIGEAFGSIYYALVPIGAYEPRCIMAGAHVNAEEAAQICADVAAKNAVAMHWGSIVLTEEPAFEPPQIFREAMQARGFTSSAIHIPAIGETLTVAAKNSKEQ